MAKVKGNQATALIKVGLQFDNEVIPVGRLANRTGKIYFEYDTDFLARKCSISPIKLPLEPGLKTFNPFLFDGLPGVIADSLPDGWGRLLIDRWLRQSGIPPSDFSVLDRLALVGKKGMGALVYEPDRTAETNPQPIDLDALALETRQVLRGEPAEVLTNLIALNGSSAGARPKAQLVMSPDKRHILYDAHSLPEGYAHWMVKFANQQDGPDAGAIEYVYALMAQRAGVEMMPVHLFPASAGGGYFATQRFDRVGSQRLHVHSASGLLHSDFRAPALDYENLIQLTGILTKNIQEVTRMFRLAVFNVLAHNRDDHGKNFSFLMNSAGEWKLAPAYDLTFSSGPNGEQSTMVMGEGRNPSLPHLSQLGLTAGLDKKEIDQMLTQTREALSQWSILASDHGVSPLNINLIGKRLGVL